MSSLSSWNKRLLPVAVAATLVIGGGGLVPAHAASTYRVQLDAKPPKAEPWAFLRIFPKAITVHQGDVIDAAWAGTGAPHTATLVPSADANAWRTDNQGPPGPQDPATYHYALQVLDTSVGGDDGEVVLNPAVGGPSDPTCGTAATPCTFDGTGVVNSGLQFSNPSAQPSFDVQVTAPVGTYTFLCLVHPGMQETVNVVAPTDTAPTPEEVASTVSSQVKHAKKVDAKKADAQAQEVSTSTLGGGATKWTINAGGFYHNVSADEFLDTGLTVKKGDRIKVLGNYEIHTATSPSKSVDRVPFIVTQCEVPGPDTPATSPADCASPTAFETAFNAKALAPTDSNKLAKRSTFVNSGLLATPGSFTFVASKPGTYTFVCLVHGPTMSTTITVKK